MMLLVAVVVVDKWPDNRMPRLAPCDTGVIRFAYFIFSHLFQYDYCERVARRKFVRLADSSHA